MSRLLKAIVKEPGKEPEEFIVTDDVEALQKLVGGYMDHRIVEDNMIVLFDDEGLIKERPYNCWFYGLNLVGTFVVLGLKNGQFTNCPITLDQFRELCE